MVDEYSHPKDARNTVNRHRERAKYDYETIHSIVNATSVLHVSFLPDGTSGDIFPTILPMIGHMGSAQDPTATLESGPLDLYVHGHSASRLMRLPGSDNTPAEGLPVCVAATILDGIKLALTPFNHSCNYRSAVLHGFASLVEDVEEKDWALRLITDGLVPKRWDNSRVPPTKSEMLSTSVLRISIVSASAKVNTGGPGDDRKDLQNDKVTGSVWTGVLPVYECIMAPQPSKSNKVATLPSYLAEFIDQKNSLNEAYARQAVEEGK